jgi:molecular chaperone HtpG
MELGSPNSIHHPSPSIINIVKVGKSIYTMEFKADTKNLLKNLKSLYKQEDIFVRELVSNSIDAGAKRVFLTFYKDSLAFADDGCGMDGDDLQKYIGSIACTSKTGNGESIGQFGLGFYSCFIVADLVKIVCKKKGDK